MKHFVGVFLLFINSISVLAAGPVCDCTARWEPSTARDFKEMPYPEIYANYWRFRAEIPAGKKVFFRIQGMYPHARYMGFNVYNQKTFDSVSSIADFQVQQDQGSENPFQKGVSRTTANRTYTVTIGPKGYSEKGTFLALPEAKTDQATAVDIWYRIYLPDQKMDIKGGVALPTILAYDAQTGEPLDTCPKRKTIAFRFGPSIRNLPPAPDGKRIRFYAEKGLALYANPDNRYLAARLDFAKGEVAVLRFKAPLTPKTADGVGKFSGGEEVRYWSFCIGGAVKKRTSGCFIDSNAKPDSLGYVTLVVGPDYLASSANAAGFGFLSSSDHFMPILIYRNLVTKPGFSGQIPEEHLWPPSISRAISSEPAKDLEARNFMKEFAPTGVHCTEEDFSKDYCGFTSAPAEAL